MARYMLWKWSNKAKLNNYLNFRDLIWECSASSSGAKFAVLVKPSRVSCPL